MKTMTAETDTGFARLSKERVQRDRRLILAIAGMIAR